MKWLPALALAVLAVAAATPQARCDEPPAELGLEKLVLAAEQRDIPAKLQIEKPRLTYQQRILLKFDLDLDLRKLQKRGVDRDLYFYACLVDAQGEVLDGYGYSHLAVSAKLPKGETVGFTASVFIRPGVYTLHVLVYDDEKKVMSVYQKPIVVKGVDKDPLPQLDAEYPPTEWLNQEGGLADYEIARHGAAPLPIDVHQPLRVDLVVNFTPSAEYAGRRSAYQRTADAMLQLSSLLERLQPQEGCVFFHGLDVQGQKVLVTNADISNFDNEAFTKQIAELDPHKVTVKSLENRRQSSIFFGDFMQRLTTSRAGCGSGRQTSRVFIVAGTGMLYPEGSPISRLDEHTCDCRFYYMRPAVVWDDLQKTFSHVHPHRFTFDSPTKLRRQLATILQDISAYANASHESAASAPAGASFNAARSAR